MSHDIDDIPLIIEKEKKKERRPPLRVPLQVPDCPPRVDIEHKKPKKRVIIIDI